MFAGFEVEGLHDFFAGEEGFWEEFECGDFVAVEFFDLFVLGEGARDCGGGVGAEEFEEVFEFGFEKPAAAGGVGHFEDGDSHHVMSDEEVDFFDDFAWEAEAREDLFGDVGADLGVVVVADAFCVLGKSGEFADVVKEGGPFECEGGFGGKRVEGAEAVIPNIAFLVILEWLGEAFELSEFGNDVFEDADFEEFFEGLAGVGVVEDHFGEFFAEAFGADFGDEVSVGFDCLVGFGVVLEVVEVFETDGAEDAQVVFEDARFGVADEADEFVAEIFLAIDEVEDFFGGGVVEKGVDGEVAAFGVLFRIGKGDGVGAAAVGAV